MRWCFRCRTRHDDAASSCPACGRPTGTFVEGGTPVDEFGDPVTLGLGKVGIPVDHELPKFLSEQFGVIALHVRDLEVERATLDRLPRETATRLQALPVDTAGETLIIALADPSDEGALVELRRVTGMHIEVVVSPTDEIAAALRRCYG